MPDPNRGFLLQAQSVLVVGGAVYIAFVALLTTPYVQRQMIYMNSLRWPLFPKFDQPAKYGLSPHRTVNFNITTADNETLGTWLILPVSQTPRQVQAALNPLSPPTPQDVRASLIAHPTILFFHGNAATRAVGFRVHHYTTYSAKFGANVLVIDYRGFADSTGTPSEAGLRLDARAAWDWLVQREVRPQDVLIVGQSLGTGVASGLAAALAKEGIHPRGVVLFAPFSSVAAVLMDYNLLGFLPLLKPLQTIPFASQLVVKFLLHRFDSQSVLQTVHAPVLLAHALNDFEIPSKHSHVLFDTLLEPFVPPAPPVPTAPALMTSNEWDEYAAAQERRHVAKTQVVISKVVDNFGKIMHFERGEDRGDVMFVETQWGTHDRIGIQDGVLDIMGRFFFQL